MNCSNCGNHIPDDSMFCTYCGSKLNKEVSHTSNTKAPKKQKNSKKIIISLAGVAIAFVIGRFAIAPAMTSDNDEPYDNSSSESYPIWEEESTPVTNTEYKEIFASRNIVEAPAAMFFLDTMTFAKVHDDGMIEKIECGYENDVVKEMVDTIYYPMTETIDVEGLKSYFDEADALSCCSVKYYEGNTYFSVTLTYKGLENADAVKELYGIGMTDGSSVEHISMKKSAEALLADGYVKK